jgi:RNA polymerase sigma-70 factor (ECF subfamily)
MQLGPDHRPTAPAALDDGDLARRIARAGPAVAGAEEAELCRRFARRVFLYGMRHLRAEDRAHDLVQDVLLLTLQKLRSGEVRDPEHIGSFILGAARLISRSRGRANRREDGIDAAADLAVAADPHPPDPLARDHVARCLEALEDRCRAVVVLTFYAEQSTADIADSLGLSANNVRVMRHRGVARLRSCLGITRPEIEA